MRLLFIAAIAIAAAAGCGQPAPPANTSISAGAAQPEAVQPRPAPITPDDDRRLGGEATQFLDAWMVRRNPSGAVKGQLSDAFAVQRFLAPDGLSVQDRSRLETASEAELDRPVAAPMFEQALARELATTLEVPTVGLAPPKELGELLAPFSQAIARETEPDLWSQWLETHAPRDISIAGVPALAYQARGWNDVSWAVTWALDDDDLAKRIAAGTINVQAVIVRLKETGDHSQPMIVMLWSDEGRPGGEWRLLTVLAPPVN